MSKCFLVELIVEEERNKKNPSLVIKNDLVRAFIYFILIHPRIFLPKHYFCYDQKVLKAATVEETLLYEFSPYNKLFEFSHQRPYSLFKCDELALALLRIKNSSSFLLPSFSIETKLPQNFNKIINSWLIFTNIEKNEII